jgi:predicted RNA-binding Zn-ribbon protein involved in translation (DUF1610 family)
MLSDYDNELVKTAVFHIRAKEYDLARRYLERALDVVDDEDTRAKASWWLSEITTDPVEKRNLLETVLAWDRNNAQARRALMILDGKLKPEEIVDANNLPAQNSGQVQVAHADRFACPNCGARMVFAPDGHSLYCEHCSRNETLADQFDSDEPVERDFLLAMATAQGHRKPVAIHSFQCKGCGATFLLAPEIISATCSYCGSPHVISIDETRELLEPDGVIPFAFEQKNAGRYLVGWAKKKKVKPDGKVELPHGIYLPVWSFDLGGEIPYTAQILVNEGRSRKVVVKTISDTYPVVATNVPVVAIRKLGRLLGNALDGFNLAEAVPYDARFLSDWPAEAYEITMSDTSLDARKKVYDQTLHEVQILLDAQGNVENFRPSSSKMSVESFKLILVPAWLTSYTAEGKTYNVLVNGQTGAVTGETPSLDLLGWVGNILK